MDRQRRSPSNSRDITPELLCPGALWASRGYEPVRITSETASIVRRSFLRAAVATTALFAGVGDATTQEGTETTGEGGGDDGPSASATANGMITVEGGQSMDGTIESVMNAIEENDLMLVTTVDHAQNASRADMELRPTTLLLFGTPAVGTPLMQSAQTAGIDLPQRLLVWEDADGTVWVTYNDPAWLADRHTIENQDELLGNVAETLDTIATSAQDD